MDRLTNLLTALATLIAIITILLIGAPGDLNWWRNAIGPMAWALSPYAAMWLLNNVIVREQRQRDLVLLVTIGSMLLLECLQIGTVLFSDAAGMITVTMHKLPLIQLLIAAAGGAIAFLLPVITINPAIKQIAGLIPGPKVRGRVAKPFADMRRKRRATNTIGNSLPV